MATRFESFIDSYYHLLTHNVSILNFLKFINRPRPISKLAYGDYLIKYLNPLVPVLEGTIIGEGEQLVDVLNINLLTDVLNLLTKLRKGEIKDNQEAIVFGNRIDLAKRKIEILREYIAIPAIDIDPDSGVIEFIYENRVSIESIADFKKRSQGLYLIMYGYARLFDIRTEDFEILEVSKNSPFSTKIKTTLKIVLAITSVITALYKIEKLYLENQILIERLHSKEHDETSDEEDIELIEKSKNKFKKRKETQIQNLIKETVLTNGKSDFDGESHKAISKAIHKHSEFINYGGTMNVFIGDNTTQHIEQLKELQASKDELHRVKEAPEMKLIEAAHIPEEESEQTPEYQ